MIQYIEYLGLPGTIGVIIVGLFLFMQVVGEFLEFKGKIVPGFMKIRKYIKRKRDEKRETADTLKAVKQLLTDVNAHYSTDNISKRDAWMTWVNNRADVYDSSIVEIKDNLAMVAEALKDNSKLTEEMFVQALVDCVVCFLNSGV